ncbi:MAG: single-stranded DNA-binding protein, partial [Treponema sp.]|nr:single-stranded DNA-binding protein [Treponema sp.]
MNSLNQIIVEGNIVREPELKSLPSGAASCTLPIAVNRKYKTG